MNIAKVKGIIQQHVDLFPVVIACVVRRLGWEQPRGFAARSRVPRTQILRLHHSCARLDKTAKPRRLQLSLLYSLHPTREKQRLEIQLQQSYMIIEKYDAILRQSEHTNLYNHLINYTKSIYMGKVIVSKMTESNRSFNIPRRHTYWIFDTVSFLT